MPTMKFVESRPALAEALEINKSLPWSAFRSSIVNQLMKNKSLSDKQADSFINAVKSDVKFAERKATQDAERATQREALLSKGVTAPEGRLTVEGKIMTIKSVANGFGGATKMLIELPTGAKAWLTLPSELRGIVIENWSDESLRSVLVGKTISVTATFKRSDTDPTFAFGSRPNPATIS